MNALWITRMAAYKYSPLRIESARQIIALKIEREAALLKARKCSLGSTTIVSKDSLSHILLEEARMAKKYWKAFAIIVPSWAGFTSRRVRGIDIGNRLLDIGYHHLTNVVRGILVKYNIPADLGLLHVARNSDSSPLAYDLVEMFRSDIVEAEVLRYLRLKKRKVESADKEISHFLHEVNERLERKYYLKDFKRCHTYRYYMEVQILKFVSAVNGKKIYTPIRLPDRHDVRCKAEILDKITDVVLP